MEGSSSNRTFGRAIKALPIANICCSPPERLHANWFRRSFRRGNKVNTSSKSSSYVDDEYAERAIRCSRTYYEYAKDICENYRMDLRRYKLIRERKQYIGVSNREAYQAMCEDLAFAQQSLKTVLNDYADLFRKRFSEGLSIRKAADAMQQNRGVIERRQAALYRAFAQLLQQRDEADGVCRLMQKIEYDQRDIEDLLE